MDQTTEKARRLISWQINKWLQDWCHSQGFGYFNHGTHFEKPGLLGADGIHLSEMPLPAIDAQSLEKDHR